MHDNSGLINNFTLGQDYFLKRKELRITNDFFFEIYKFVWKTIKNIVVSEE